MKNKVLYHMDCGNVVELRVLSKKEVVQLSSEVRKGYKEKPWEYLNERWC